MAAKNQRPDRVDFEDKVTGRAEFISDVIVPGMVHGRVLRSTVPHAMIKRIDIEAALAMPGVVGVVVGTDFVGIDPIWGVSLKERPLLAIDRVRYVGEPVAVVVAESEAAAEEALEAIDVDYDLLPFVVSAADAMAADAPVIHERMETLKDFYFKGEAKPVEGTNIFQRYQYAHGDIDGAFASSDRVFEDQFEFPMVFHYAMEPHCGIASFDEDGLTVWSCGQSPSLVQKVLSRIFDLPLARVRVITPLVGGGFGGKASVKIDPMIAAVAWKVRRPVRVCLSIGEAMLTARRLSATISVKTGVMNDGTLTGKSVKVLMNGGAYADTGPAVAVKSVIRAIGPYHFPNLKLEAVAVYTNTVPGAAFRSIGGPQGVWATESQMDMIAAELGIDPTDFRYRNILKRGEHVRPDLRPIDVDMGEAMGLAAQAMSRIEAHSGQTSVKGSALGVADPANSPFAGVMLRIKIDGSIQVICPSVEIGQGIREVLCRVASEELRQPVSAASVTTPDTAIAPFDWGTGASRSSLMMAMAIEEAAKDIKKQFAEIAEKVVGADAASVELVEGGIACDGGRRRWTFADILHPYFGVDSGEIIGIGRISPFSRGGSLAQSPLFWETAAGRCGITLDEDTGEVRVRNYVSVADIGRAINRSGAEGQDEGAAIMGLGHALSEELLYADGQPINATMIDYHVPTIEDVPDVFETVLIENGGGPGPGGMRGMGEGAILPIAPAIANALHAGYGIRVTELPLTPERVWRALDQRRKSNGL